MNNLFHDYLIIYLSHDNQNDQSNLTIEKLHEKHM